ncbi:SusC/RagA family TonB-linked outer membrane protein [Tenacibaculum soleae]|uniref:SusC/RagA family TonB-linked outer membrane protein n=1 Tax=Tenacibaculum soleae TaxID=447689 RepID=UPI0026E43FBF|nr:SusC/RagA family TonB-linked outer membrane protein [Tenacibaculum soleae]MDO6812673.1 SusC/RagA family TonB-linked outer membrane protein [Tenacibaculum soleae]
MKKSYKTRLLLIYSLLFCSLIFSQTHIKGKIVDQNNIPLPNASIIEKGTTNGTLTNFDGDFSFKVKNNATIVVSYLGFNTQEIKVSEKKNITIVLKEDETTLNEVVITALGIKQQQKKLGYATQKMKTNTIEDVPVPNTANLFTGQVAGLTVSNPTGLFQKANIKLRGGSPIIVIDGIIVDTDFYDLSPNNIAGINVLKGQTAAALYGSKGKDGAILITTKNVKKEGIEISFSHNNMISAGFTIFPETQTEYGNGSNGKYEFWDGKDGGISDGDMIWGPKFEPGVLIKQWNSPILDNVTGKEIPWWGDVTGTEYDDKSRYSRVATPWKYHNNLKDFMGTAFISNTNFSISQKGENGSLKLTANYKSHDDRVPNASLKTGGLTFKSSTILSKKLALDTKLAYNKVYSPNYPRHGYGPKNHMYTILIWMGDDVNGKDLKNHMYITGQEGYRQANYNYAWYNNPYFAAQELKQQYDANLINAQMSLKYTPTDNFDIQFRGSGVIKDVFEDRKSPKTYLNYGDPRAGDYKTWNKRTQTYNFDLLAHYKKDLSKNLTLDLNIGASSFYKKHQQEYNATDGLIIPFNYNLNNTKGNVKANTYLSKEASNSVYATLGIDLYNTVFFNVTGRNDWSSTLPKENSSYFYPSASISTLVSNLFTMPEAVDYLKVKASWAKVSGALDPYQISSYYDKNGDFDGKTKLNYPNLLVNPNIKPESKSTFEVGLTTSLLSNKLGLDFTYYKELSTNQIIELPVSLASGFENRFVNGNEYTRKGYEVVVNVSPIKTDKLSWDMLVNWSTSEKRITSIYDNKPNFGYLKLNDRVDSHITKTWQKSANNELIINSKGLPVRNSFESNIGHKDPKWRLGFQNNFKINKFTIGVGIDGAWGGLIRSRTVEKMWWGGKHPNSTEYRDKEYAAGKAVYVPNGVNVINGSVTHDVFGNITSDTRVYQKNTTAVNWQSWSQTYPYRAAILDTDNKKFANVFDRSFFKLRSLSIKYDFTEMFDIKKVKNISATLSGYNLLAWKKADIIDPDFGNDENLQDPSTRYIGFGINVKF